MPNEKNGVCRGSFEKDYWKLDKWRSIHIHWWSDKKFVGSKAYQDTFGINHNQVKKLEKKKVIDVVGQYEFRAYGRNLKAPLYDIYQFASIPEEVIKNT